METLIVVIVVLLCAKFFLKASTKICGLLLGIAMLAWLVIRFIPGNFL